MIRRRWTAEQADAWTREDWLVVVLSPLSMAALMLGVVQSLLLQAGGIAMLVAAVCLIFLIYWIIDPKLRSISQEYESRQAAYVEQLERRLRWQDEQEA
ncbi:hypothetical protein GW813_11680 [bacterium]|nr:hypothetical protein [bacterium]